MVDSKRMIEHQAKIEHSLSLLEKCKIAEKYPDEEHPHEYKFALSEQVIDRLAALVVKNKGNTAMACLTLVFEKIAKGKKNAQSLEALEYHMGVLHYLAFGKEPSKKDLENLDSPDDKCDAICELCLAETFPTKEIEIDKKCEKKL
jgi:hypothetical protein